MDVEAAVLTGGESRRMGSPKDQIEIEGRTIAERISAELSCTCACVTVLGRAPISGYRFIEDTVAFGGPLVALAGLKPEKAFVFVASCDLPRFDGAVVSQLRSRIGDRQAAVPTVDGWDQSLCALYTGEAIEVARTLVSDGERSMRAFLAKLSVVRVDVASLDLPPNALRSANDSAELEAILRRCDRR